MNKVMLFVVNVDWFFVSHRLPIALAAIDRGYKVHLACSFTDKKNYLQDLGLELHEVPFSRAGLGAIGELSALRSLYRVFSSVKPDIVHAVTIKPVLYGGVMSRVARVPAFVAAISGLGLVFVATDVKNRITKTIAKVLYKIALGHKNSTVIFQNETDRKNLVESVKLPVDKTVLINGSGVDLDEYSYKKGAENFNDVVMASRLLIEKGVYEFVDAARKLRKKGLTNRFLLIGEPDTGNPNTITISELDAWEKEGLVVIMGFRSDIAKIFANSAVVVLPSFYGEGLPKVLIEAAACGRPIVTTNNQGCKDAVLDGQTGILVPIKDSDSLADAIESLLLNKDTRRYMGNNARKFAETQFSIQGVVEAHLSIYEKLTA